LIDLIERVWRKYRAFWSIIPLNTENILQFWSENWLFEFRISLEYFVKILLRWKHLSQHIVESYWSNIKLISETFERTLNKNEVSIRKVRLHFKQEVILSMPFIWSFDSNMISIANNNKETELFPFKYYSKTRVDEEWLKKLVFSVWYFSDILISPGNKFLCNRLQTKNVSTNIIS